ncbi:MAG: PAS domain S-box protein [Gemmatimonadaceae bacterium]
MKPTTASPAGASDPQALLRESKGLYKLLVDKVQDYAIFALDPLGNILTWNAGAQRLKGYLPHEIIGKHFSVFYPRHDIEAGKPDWELEVATRVGQVEDEGWRLRKDGSHFWANVLITALRDDDGQLIGFAKVTRDLTERRKAEEKVRESEERFRLLVQSVEDYAIFMLDANGYVATWNTGAKRIKGYEADEIVGKHFSVFYPPEDVEAGKPKLEIAVATQTGKFEEEGWRLRKDGTRFWASVVLTSVHLPDGTLTGFAKVTRDLTERLAAQERAIADAQRVAGEEAARTIAEANTETMHALMAELDAQRSAADRANRAKSEFLAAMSHELRTPLNAIGGYAQLLEMEVNGPITAGQREQLERLQRSQRHLLGIINDILNFSRIEAGQITYEVGYVHVRDILEQLGSMIMPQAHAKKLALNVATCPASLVVYADQAKTQQILINLLSNAVKFTPDGGEVELTCGKNDDHVWFKVRDTGVGIRAEQLESVFAPFVQVGRGLANPQEGTGLGLAISRNFARAMRGDLTVESEEGVGSTFTLTLPLGE